MVEVPEVLGATGTLVGLAVTEKPWTMKVTWREWTRVSKVAVTVTSKEFDVEPVHLSCESPKGTVEEMTIKPEAD